MRHHRHHPLQSNPCDHASEDRNGERGVALIIAALFTIVVVGITVTGTLILKSHRATTSTNFITHGQSLQFSKSGLTETLGWMRKQTSQPVTAFEPQLDMGATPQVIDTLDPDIGIVREFRITDSIWGRYEVWKKWDSDPDPARLLWRQQMQSEDVSTMRGDLSPGSVWRVRSIGFVFRQVDPMVAFNVAPNQVLGQEMTEVEVRRLALQPPGQAALCTRNGSGVEVLTRGRIIGGALAGIYYASGTGTASVSGSGASVTGTPGQAATSTYADDWETVFGVSQAELTAMANYVVATPANFPSPVPIDAIVISTTAMTFTAALPLKGTGVVAIVGDATIDQGSYSAFSGLLYVQGDLIVREPCLIQGSVVVTGTVTVQGASDYATLTYDDAILEHLRQEIGTYRLSSAVSRPFAQDN